MGRNRTIDRDAVLAAAERVVVRDGAARLTLDAVAAEAGISKAAVLYDWKTKQGLIAAMIKRRVASEDGKVAEAMQRLPPGPDQAVKARLDVASQRVSDEDRNVILSLCAFLARDVSLREPIQQSMRRRLNDILGGSRHPRGALLAFLAMEGLMALEWLDIKRWSDDERAQLIAEMEWLIGQSPEPEEPGA